MLIRDLSRVTQRHGYLIRVGRDGVAPAPDGGIIQPIADWPSGAVALGEWQGAPIAVFGENGSADWPAARQWLHTLPRDQFPLLSSALQVLKWLRDHRFCGRCGKRMKRLEHGFAMHCTGCQHRSYPRISPCIITLITRGREMLLARSPRFGPGMYSTLAGFIEAGESAEEAVRREVHEEVGVEVGRVSYFQSQSWPFPHSFMLGYYAEYAGGDITIDGVEIEDAQWFTPEDLPGLPPKFSISHALIDNFLRSVATGR